MGLDEIKNRVIEEEFRQESIHLANEKKKMDKIQEEEHKLYLSLTNDLPKLKLIENEFWRYAEKFGSIIRWEINKYDKRRTFLGIFNLSSIETKNSYNNKRHYAKISVCFEKYTDENHIDYMYYRDLRIRIDITAKQENLVFNADFYTPSHYGNGVQFSGEIFTKYEQFFNIEKFNKTVTIKWLEEQFVIFYKNIEESGKLNPKKTK
jgi:hypothetical protein